MDNKTNSAMTPEMLDAIRDGVQKEKDAHDFYLAAAAKVKSDDLRDLFSDLAAEELGHKIFLERVLSEQSFGKSIKEQKNDYKLAEELIEEKPELSTDMSFNDAIALAVKREEEAMNSYQEMADQVSDNKEFYDMFINLRNMEQAHKTRLESIYMNTAYSEVW